MPLFDDDGNVTIQYNDVVAALEPEEQKQFVQYLTKVVVHRNTEEDERVKADVRTRCIAVLERFAEKYNINLTFDPKNIKFHTIGPKTAFKCTYLDSENEIDVQVFHRLTTCYGERGMFSRVLGEIQGRLIKSTLF